MATTVNYGWLKDKNGNKFSPTTLSSQIITNEGKSFEDEIKQQIESASTSTNGIIVSITTDGWTLQSDGTYKKTITVTELTGNETLDMCLYPGDTHTQEQIIAYCEKITSVDIEAGKLILTASEALTVSFRVFLYGKVEIDEDSIVALGDNVLEVKTVTQEYYDNLPASEKAQGVYITDGDDLTAKNIYYDGSESGLGNTVQGSIDELNKNMGGLRFGVDGDGNYGYYGADDSLIPFSNIASLKWGKVTGGAVNAVSTIDLGGKPKQLFIYGMNSNTYTSPVLYYDGKTTNILMDASIGGNSYFNLSIIDNGFSISQSLTNAGYTYIYGYTI